MSQSSLELCNDLLDELMSNPDSKDFLYPVPWKEWNLMDYPEIVKQPMDLNTVKTKLSNNEYHDVYAFANDIRLIWSNCLAYNPEGSAIRDYAIRLQTKFEDRFKHLEGQLPEKEKMPSIQKKTQFANNFGLLSAPQISYIVSIIENNCPEAIIHNADDTHDIKVDAIPVPVFHTLNDYVVQSVSRNSLVS